jgi:hypothetical protein
MAQPTLNELRDAYINDLEAELGITIPEDSKNFLFTMASVHGARLKLLYLNQAKLQKNIFVDTAEYESQGGTLERFGRIKLGRSPFPAISGEYSIQFTGVNGTVIPASTVFNADESSSAFGFRFILDDPYTLGTFPDAVIRALTPGTESALDISDTLTLESPIANVDSTVVVLAEETAPQESEPLEEYREKIEEAFRLEPQGGAGADYRIWAGDAQGVDESYPFTGNVNNNIEVNLYIEATVADSTDGKGTPPASMLTAVQEAIEDPTPDRPSRKPLTHIVNYLPVTPLDVNITIPSFVPPTAASPGLVEQSIDDLINSIRPYVGSIDTLSEKNDTLSTNNIIGSIYAAAPGAQFGSITLEVDGNNVQSYTFEFGEIPYLNSVTIIIV